MTFEELDTKDSLVVESLEEDISIMQALEDEGGRTREGDSYLHAAKVMYEYYTGETW